jgi:biopolymer transport protein ExbD
MPRVKLARKSTDTDMTPFVDIAFLILSFFIMATKFKPPEAVEIKTPASVLSKKLPESNAALISIDSSNRVFFTLLSEKDKSKYDAVIDEINTSQNLGLGENEKRMFRRTYMTGVPFSGLKQLLNTDPNEQAKLNQPGIPVLDSTNNQLIWWIRATKDAFAGTRGFRYLIKGDNNSKYPAFEAVINALRKNEEFKYDLVTALEGVPRGSDLDKYQKQIKSGAK